ncbi:DUF3048 domain-containing protein [Peribacillus saganii]|uniref:DUF3048 domain-containing protein n=1 Tax=Peribacillus saganii TaxID=2303992 RepID=A0A372LN53_9BACI|nr:DUF3048 domain-containing protein [Peribacillus saganii]RFU68913.1 DUF3048 domain-containing protein [Peribacillus saganii]
MKLKTVACLLAMSLMAAGCNKDVGKETPKIDKEDVKFEKEVSAEEEFVNQYPLTGIGTDESIESRAIAVMVNNHPKARPQTGLSKADIVYEMLAEGDVTRFLAVFQSERPEKIGPVRSARDYYIRIAKGLNGIFIAHGYSPDAKKLLDSGYIDHLNGMEYDGTLFKRASFRQAPHNSYITFEKIEKGISDNSFDGKSAPKAFTFLTEEQIESLMGEEAVSIKVAYGSPVFDSTFEYDEGAGKFIRYSDGEQTVDSETKEPVAIDNVLVIEAPHQVIDKAGRRDIDFKAGGKAILLQKGKMNEAEWRNIDGRIVPFQEGKEAGLMPGKTWIAVVSEAGIANDITLNSN